MNTQIELKISVAFQTIIINFKMDSSNSSSSSSSSSNNNKSSWRPKAAAEIVDLTNDISDKEDETSYIKRPMIDISFIRQLLPTTEDNVDNDDHCGCISGCLHSCRTQSKT